MADQTSKPDEYFSRQAQRILFLGDSITYAGHFLPIVEAQLYRQAGGIPPELINLGLPGETCSGLSEPGRPAPRPCVHDRLETALKKTEPDLVVICYGMNDGIYHPFSKHRFKAYQNGINTLVKQVQATGAQVILMTSPPFDPVPLENSDQLRPADAESFGWGAIAENYDEVIERYATWIMQQEANVAQVIDLHRPIRAQVASGRRQDPRFNMSPDGVHLNQQGHRILGEVILQAWGLDLPEGPDDQLVVLLAERSELLRDAWLTRTGHGQTDIPPGLPWDEVQREVGRLEASVQAQLTKRQGGNSGH